MKGEVKEKLFGVSGKFMVKKLCDNKCKSVDVFGVLFSGKEERTVSFVFLKKKFVVCKFVWK